LSLLSLFPEKTGLPRTLVQLSLYTGPPAHVLCSGCKSNLFAMATQISPPPQVEKMSTTPSARKKAVKNVVVEKPTKLKSYTSEGVKNNDIFQLPGSDWQLLGVLTCLAAVVRLFRIFQPSSVVFDEVQ